jgi:hypothetical protein
VTDYPTSVIKNNSANSLAFETRQNMSIYSKNSIISNSLMKILYSADSKENIQKNIEHYLISQQNKLLLKDIGDIKLNYKLVNPKIVDVLIESKLIIKKLHLNVILQLQHKNVKDVDIFGLYILSKLDLDDIINIIFGRLLLIISNNNIYNKSTNFTDVAYDLGKELINKYNYKLYLLHSNKEQNNTFSQFMLKNPTIIIDCDDPTVIVGLGSILIG